MTDSAVSMYQPNLFSLQDSVRLIAVNVGISIAARLNSDEVEEFVLKSFQELAGKLLRIPLWGDV